MKKKKQEIKDLIENNPLYDFSLYEKRILYRCLILVYKFYNGENIEDCYEVIYDNEYFSIGIPVSTIFKGEEDVKHEKLKKSLLRLFENELIDRPQIIFKDDYIRFFVYPDLENRLSVPIALEKDFTLNP